MQSIPIQTMLCGSTFNTGTHPVILHSCTIRSIAMSLHEAIFLESKLLFEDLCVMTSGRSEPVTLNHSSCGWRQHFLAVAATCSLESFAAFLEAFNKYHSDSRQSPTQRVSSWQLLDGNWYRLCLLVVCGGYQVRAGRMHVLVNRARIGKMLLCNRGVG